MFTAPQQSAKATTASALSKAKKLNAQLQSNDGTKIVPLDSATPKQTVIISEDLTSRDEENSFPVSAVTRMYSPGLPSI
jgi:hypothetical protein